MAEAAAHTQTYDRQIQERGISPQLTELRLLTEVSHLRQHLLPDGTISDTVMRDVRANMDTAVQEMAIPGAVTTSVQRVERIRDETGRSRRIITWLGKTAVEVAESGYQFHKSPAARRRVDVEVAEARYNESNLLAGQAKVFISPRMTEYDAPAAVAKSEHLHSDDAVRVSYAVTDAQGEVVAQRIESLLVTDIPLEAWKAMLSDEDNLFGRSFDVAKAHSAVSVMELFDRMSLPEVSLPEGPVSIVETVLPYITDFAARTLVSGQLQKYRTSQEKYRRESAKIAAEWLAFDLELARSLEAGVGNLEIQRFIAGLQYQWAAKDLSVIRRHDVAGEYIMTTELAAVLERAQRHLLMSKAALAVGNERVLRQTDAATARELQQEMQRLDTMAAQGLPAADIAFARVQFMRRIARQNFKVGGGCAGSSESSFGSSESNGQGETSENDHIDADGSQESSEDWTWKKGVCRVDKCPSPQPTEVGPCSVCRNCQHKFDSGMDPTRGSRPAPAERTEQQLLDDIWKDLLEQLKTAKEETSKDSKLAVTAGNMSLSAV